MTATAQPGTLVLMGSGETTPTMVTIHKTVLQTARQRSGDGTFTAALLNTPYGFQENAPEITAKAQQYFDHNVGQDVSLIDAGVIEGADGMTVERSLDAVRGADWLFAGPGSPTYALRQWRAAPFLQAMTDVHRDGGTLVFASAAAVTVGSHALPVYEVYKAGEEARWREGLSLVQALTGWPCVVIPHFDNAEGGTHDTRFCYMGERRLSALEADLPDDAWILGIDEHTACVIDGPSQTVRVEGRGGIHVRRHGQIVLDVPAGQQITMADLAAAGTGATPVDRPGRTTAAGDTDADVADPVETAEDPIAEQLDGLRARFDAALADGDADAATAAALDTEQLIRDWSADSLVSDGLKRAVSQLRAMITRLGALAAEGMHDHTELVRPIIETLLHVRDDARERKVFEVADHIRGHMDADGVKVKDTREGTVWEWDEPAI